MNQDVILDIMNQALYLIAKVSAPILITSLVVGLIISILQTVTSIQEQTLTFVPKLLITFLVIALLGSWMITNLKDFTTELFSNFSYYISN